MKLGSTWYCMTNACSQPAKTGGCGIAQPDERFDASQAVHHSIASSRLPAPMKNIRRCGAWTSCRADRAGRAMVASWSMAQV